MSKTTVLNNETLLANEQLRRLESAVRLHEALDYTGLTRLSEALEGVSNVQDSLRRLVLASEPALRQLHQQELVDAVESLEETVRALLCPCML